MAIKIAFINFWKNFDLNNSVLMSLLKKHFDVMITNDNPDFVIASTFGDIRNVLRYNCPRIFYSGEPRTPDFSLFDYGIGSDFLSIIDQNGKSRYYRFPEAFTEWHNAFAASLNDQIDYHMCKKILESKTAFCNFIYSHDTKDNARKKVFDLVSSYKRVDSLGSYLYNMDNLITAEYNPDKIKLQNNYKFSIIYEAIKFPGFVTEKIVHAFAANTIPIYLGDPLIELTFNTDSFIDVRKYGSQELLELLIKIDKDDNLFIEYLSKQKYVSPNYYNNLMGGLEDFLVYIFSQNPVEAFRRPNEYSSLFYENYILESKNSNDYSFFQLIKLLIKKVLRVFK